MLKKTVLIVDPNKVWADRLYEAMQRSGLYVVAIPLSDGGTALDCIQSFRPNIIIMDMLMNSFDGRYVVNFIRNYMEGYNPLVYLMSAIPADHLVMQWNDMGNVFFAKKPQTISCTMDNIKYLVYENGTVWPRPVILQIPERSDRIQEMKELDSKIEKFLLRLDNRINLKGFISAKAVLKLLLTSKEEIQKAAQLYSLSAEELCMTPLQIERNLRSFRSRASRTGSNYYLKYLSAYNESNSVFYWNAYRVLREELMAEDQK